VGSRRDCTWILGLAGFRVVTTESDGESSASRLTIRIERRGLRGYPCSGCGGHVSRVRSARDRTWDDLSWAAHPVTLLYAQRRVRCRHCGIRTEWIEFADSKRASPDACGSRSAWTVSRCPRVMPRFATE
jgi:transposase